MGFSFNWSGITVPQANINYTGAENARRDADMLGRAARGYQTRQANEEYADLIRNGVSKSNPRIAQLEARNAEIRARIAEIDKQIAANTPHEAEVDTSFQFNPNTIGFTGRGPANPASVTGPHGYTEPAVGYVPYSVKGY